MKENNLKINVLPETIVNKIAAGEVIERPASVVKELVENAIDASADRIDVCLEESGKKLIKVVDNGAGMENGDIARAVLSHSTSKLLELDDVYAIRTLGFRGEALPSIGAIARVRIVSRTRDGIAGGEIVVEGGEIGDVNEKGCAVGTQIEVRDIFYNTPVRKKFLKSNPIEMAHISEIITRLALANPQIHFSLYHNGRTVFNLPSAATIKERIITFFGNEMGDNLITVKSMEPNLVIKGYVLPPSNDCRTTKMQYVFVNSRFIRDKSILHAISEAYKGMLMSNRKPIVFLFLQIDPLEFDVNVHPTKIEVRFKNVRQVYGQILTCLRSSLERARPVTTAKFAAAAFTGSPGDVRPAGAGRSGTAPTPYYIDKQSHFDVPVSRENESVSVPFVAPGRQFAESGNMAGGRCMQVQDSYIVEEVADGINIIDQHALHEIILYDEIIERVKGAKVISQKLLIPEPMELTASEYFIIISLRDKLGRLGFVVDEFGKNTVIIRAYPQILKDLDCKEFMRGLLGEIDESICDDDVDACLDKLARVTACKGAVKMGQKLNDQEIEALLNRRETVSFNSNCPHGRPTSILMPFYDLERQFKRR